MAKIKIHIPAQDFELDVPDDKVVLDWGDPEYARRRTVLRLSKAIRDSVVVALWQTCKIDSDAFLDDVKVDAEVTS